jgi:hypothetical protein
MKKIDDPKQNQHCWCGILATDEKETDLRPNQKYAFLKLNKESHFISQGTVITDVIQVNVGDIDKSIDKALASLKASSLLYDGLFDKIKKDIEY